MGLKTQYFRPNWQLSSMQGSKINVLSKSILMVMTGNSCPRSLHCDKNWADLTPHSLSRDTSKFGPKVFCRPHHRKIDQNFQKSSKKWWCKKTYFRGSTIFSPPSRDVFLFSAKIIADDHQDLRAIFSDTTYLDQFFMKSSKNEYLSK